MKDEDGTIGEDAYITLNVKLGQALMPDFDEEEARAGAHEDWNTDSGGDNKLTYKEFYNSIFELVDVWTPTMEEALEDTSSTTHALTLTLTGGARICDLSEQTSFCHV